jgi:NADH dehydrogenase
LRQWAAGHGNVQLLTGGLFDAAVYAPALTPQTTVLHLAAVTGKAPRETFFRVNAQGVQVLLEQCQAAGVQNLLYVSTIAVNYPDKTNYFYAQAKAAGEQAVQQSGLDYLIVRPTIVIGPGSAALNGLAKFVRRPLVLTLGDGQNRIQPIYVGDLAAALLLLTQRERFDKQIIELGGPEPLTLAAFLRAFHRAQFHTDPRWVVRLPLAPLVKVLTLLERSLGERLPVQAGQLSAFGNDGTIRPSAFYEQQRGQLKSVAEMLRLSLERGARKEGIA